MSVTDLIASLTIDGHVTPQALPWLAESWSDGPRFFRALAAGHAGSLPSRPKSVVLERYDLSFDLVGRNALGDRPAFRWEDRAEGWQVLSYAELAELSARRAAEWGRHGVEAGQTVCVLLPVGPAWVIALLAALRLGCVISLLPPAGPRFLARRLAALAPDHIATTELHALSLDEEARALVIPEDLKPCGRRDESFVYATGAVMARLFSPIASRSDRPLELTVDEAYCHALRDGLIAHGLLPGATFAAPGADLLQYQPALLFATFMAGGEYVHVELEAVQRDPTAFIALELSVVGVMPRVRDLLLEAKAAPGKRWVHWWRGINEESDYLRWQRFVSEAGLTTVPTSNLLVDASAGGATLLSFRRRQKWGGLSSFVLPAPGTAWSLTPLGGAPKAGDAASLELTIGLHAPRPLVGKKARTPDVILRRHQEEWYYAGVARPTREGRAYPVDEVIEVARELPFLEGVSVVPMPTSDPARPFGFHLIGFVGRAASATLAGERDAWRKVIERGIAQELSPAYLPDRVELFPFSPRRKKGEVDAEWCRDRYARGRLHERVGRDVPVLLDELRALAGATP